MAIDEAAASGDAVECASMWAEFDAARQLDPKVAIGF
jgi:hypothetical protein